MYLKVPVPDFLRVSLAATSAPALQLSPPC